MDTDRTRTAGNGDRGRDALTASAGASAGGARPTDLRRDAARFDPVWRWMSAHALDERR